MKYESYAKRLESNGKREDVVTLIDLSPSMDFTDYEPSRLHGAILANTKLIQRKAQCHPDDRMGIIGFWGRAVLLHAMVHLNKGLHSLCRALNAPQGGESTNFTAAFKLAEKCLFPQTFQMNGGFLSWMFSPFFQELDVDRSTTSNSSPGLKRIILLTDGDHNQGPSPLTVVAGLKQKGVVIDCIGIGGSPEDVDEKLLKQIASPDHNGMPRYCFINDTDELIRKYQSMAHHIQTVQKGGRNDHS